MPELGKDPVVGRWVIISTERARGRRTSRPSPSARAERIARSAPATRTRRRPRSSPAARGTAQRPGWSVRVVPNKFPALRIEGELEPAGEGLYDRMNGVGRARGRHRDARPRREARRRCPSTTSARSWSPTASASSTSEGPALRVRPGLQEPRRRRRRVARAPALPADRDPDPAGAWWPEELEGAAELLPMKERCVWCDIVRQERREGAGSSLEEDGFVAVAPFAPRFPFETWILPTTHRPASRSLQRTRRTRWRRLLGDLILRGSAGCCTIRPTTSRSTRRRSGSRTRALPLAPRDHAQAHPDRRASSWGTGFFINPTPPEDAARFLRQAGTAASARRTERAGVR